MFTDSLLLSLAQRIDSQYALRHDPKIKPLAYGTAGFRTTGELLPPVAARVITIAILRAWFCGARQAPERQCATCSVGFMITASHNRAFDNGFKIIDTNGGMLAASWEHWCTEAANAVTGAELVSVIKKCVGTEEIKHVSEFKSPCGVVLIGRDTRETGATIEAAAADILSIVLQIPFTAYGVLTTPQLHYMVERANESDAVADHIKLDAYHEQILSSFEELLTYTNKENVKGSLSPQSVVVDCANGVGALGMQRLLSYSRSRAKGDILSEVFSLELVNDIVENPALLNENCGADYAKLHARPSESMRKWPLSGSAIVDSAKTHFYCLDGDSDRLVAFFYNNRSNNDWVLLDGDRIAILYAMLLHKWLGEKHMRELDVGVVQTAYANGASTDFLKSKLRMPVYIAATGVKNLHPVAHARDIGVYFEANGHGTMLLSDKLVKGGCAAHSENLMSLMNNLRGLLSQVCGDAIGDLLMCEVALQALDMSFEDWAALYADRPCNN
ncbi:putative phosphoacetylglucosamine mutase-like protein [Leptomonas pyrrhocoris]|uniref:Phosphoacetylglucosamine mutase-like protein n=1 Tax=Leptomonas pyrrhocoris TaxID=157538 RepID=A0A0N0DRK5_LEPPY|nr:phosphoacetylglucosamine mutase-like protein [Leptomonas pyrrhocoris]XP_015652719.1 phosphoacetylglucosamine mutase-like protein [Leptomonas pyrrhocoris]XP_015652720.1 putative phosphoacetylglucosamine mutase-like protein [Leptomonas pyrrhocoris]KPA74279.1 phosphoacetylglucosamine mutase-like protein [Leptomonas pyrrhocoris]KPA74280.1 phosphoacetylglucosamine mutase-like protein [Leptomonas pyrrhocoris]KPA74281.1 putative phosphoacetylglucosamine mutase-like protein [Leptomonas pyrrhocoris]|eukprot:XP_015652718.1 phosphoacetylglucosamine mutase-like protein [Leptomonas pyrrhocoris]